MAKKITRGITGIKEINKQDFDTNNVNDLLSDGQYNYIHRKKGKSEEYHNLTDNIKTISSDNTDLLTVTNNNKTNNTATLHPKHDAQKEQVLESERNTVTIQHGTNATPEKTKVDTNPQKVLEHDNLTANAGLLKSHESGQNTTNLSVDFSIVQDKLLASDGITIDRNTIKPKIIDNYGGDLNDLTFNAMVKPSESATNMPPNSNPFGVLHIYRIGNVIVQVYYNYVTKLYIRTANTYNHDNMWGNWTSLQQSLSTNTSIGVDGSGLRQLYTSKQNYTHANGTLKTHVKSISSNTSVTTPEEEFNFILKINQGQQSTTFTLNEHDKTKFNNIITTYGASNAVRISGALFELSDSTLSVTTDANTGNNYVITFSDII